MTHTGTMADYVGKAVEDATELGIYSHADMVAKIDDALRTVRNDALEEAAKAADDAVARVMTKLRKLEKPNADLAGAAAVGAADMAEKLATAIRALKS